jgi:hypothetical protein
LQPPDGITYTSMEQEGEMKRLCCAAGIVALIAALVSCAGFPEPESSDDSLVIGSLILDFPDGFFDTPPQEFDMNVKINFKNTTKDTSFSLYTSRGYYYFLTNGTDEYVLEDFLLQQVVIGNSRYTFGGGQLKLPIAATPGKVIYLGHLVVTYAAPQATKRRGQSTYFDYKSSASLNWDENTLLQYIRQQQPNSPWLDLEVIHYGKK